MTKVNYEYDPHGYRIEYGHSELFIRSYDIEADVNPDTREDELYEFKLGNHTTAVLRVIEGELTEFVFYGEDGTMVGKLNVPKSVVEELRDRLP